MKKVVSFGEILLRLASPGYTRLFQKDVLETTFCGGEANVAVSLSIFGLDSIFVTKLPQNDIATAAVNSLNYFGVDTSKIIYGEGRMGLYYLEKGVSQRASKVIYDRKYSSIALAEKNDFKWNSIFENCDWFHWTGINPALSQELDEICLEACRVAKENGIIISCDLNYRKNLWNSEKARNTMIKFMPYIDICIANEEDIIKVLGIEPRKSNIEKGILDFGDYQEMAEKICIIYGCKYVAITLRKSYSASQNIWSAMLFDGKEKKSYFSKEYDIQIVDRVGGGDSFAAGLIYSMLSQKSNQDSIEFAVAASCLKHTIEGDYNRNTLVDVENLLKSGGNGRINR